MSSKRKDARWQLAFDMADAAGLEWNELPYSATRDLLQVAEAMLVLKAEDEIQEYARRFDNEG